MISRRSTPKTPDDGNALSFQHSCTIKAQHFRVTDELLCGPAHSDLHFVDPQILGSEEV